MEKDNQVEACSACGDGDTAMRYHKHAPSPSSPGGAMAAAREIVDRALVYYADLDGEPRTSKDAPGTTVKIAKIIYRHMRAESAVPGAYPYLCSKCAKNLNALSVQPVAPQENK